MPDSDQVLTGQEWSHLIRLLADFAAWLTPPWVDEIDQEHYHTLARRFLEQRRSTRIVDPPASDPGQCDLCGQPFSHIRMAFRESLTGDNYVWCQTCYTQQRQVFSLIGQTIYRGAWRRQQEAQAYVDR